MKCNNCGIEINDGFKFCPKCGTKTISEGIVSHGDCNNEVEREEYSISQKILLYVGIFAILINAFILFFSDYKPERDFRFLPFFLMIIGLLSPISFLIKYKYKDDDYTYAILSVIGGLIISIISGLVLKNDDHDFLSDFFEALSSNGFSIFCFILLVFSLMITWKMRYYGLLVTSFLLGFLSPMIIAAILYLVLIIVVLLIAFVFALGNRGGSASPSSIVGNSGSSNNGNLSNATHYYDIEWEDEKGYKKTSSTHYSGPVSYDQVANDFKSKFWGNGINIRIISIKKTH